MLRGPFQCRDDLADLEAELGRDFGRGESRVVEVANLEHADAAAGDTGLVADRAEIDDHVGWVGHTVFV